MHPIVIKAIKALSLEPNAFEMPAISSMAFFMHIYSVNTAYPSSLMVPSLTFGYAADSHAYHSAVCR